jgi:hypothetical protein
MTTAEPPRETTPVADEAGDQPAEDATSAQTSAASVHDQAEGDDDAGDREG